MTELYDMPVREEETPICWDVVEFAMSQLNIEFNRPKISLEEKTVVPAVVAGEVVSLVGTAIPVVEQKNKSNADQFSARFGFFFSLQGVLVDLS